MINESSKKFLLSVWIAIFGIVNFVWFYKKTVFIFSTLKLSGLTVFITPSGLIWFVLVSGCWYGCIILLVRLWRNAAKDTILLFILTPPLLSFLILILGNGFYPLIISNNESYLKMFPFM